MTPYEPKPIDTAAVALTAEQQALVERLAANAHDVWAVTRMEQGWTFGPARDDAAKAHPCLIPYEDLPESEKAVDRKMVDAVLKTILALGYTVAKTD